MRLPINLTSFLQSQAIGEINELYCTVAMTAKNESLSLSVSVSLCLCLSVCLSVCLSRSVCLSCKLDRTFNIIYMCPTLPMFSDP